MLIRPARVDDLAVVATFPQTSDELFYVHPVAQFPLTAEQLLPNFQNRKGNTVIESSGAVVAFANYISVTEQGDATIG
ncbi:MAG TPA: GNAT family N-acetyltransferase, partial [Candidatus Kapabacteria bacterium]|nr:GNAT family N-acetyltransferase [Candidatus Kapabacteria bacterium]